MRVTSACGSCLAAPHANCLPLEALRYACRGRHRQVIAFRFSHSRAWQANPGFVARQFGEHRRHRREHRKPLVRPVRFADRHPDVEDDEIARAGYSAWSTVHAVEPLVFEVDAAHRTLARRVRDALDAGADAILAFCEDGPEVYLQLEAMPLVIPRDVQLVALCATDCALNDRLGVTHVCVHPELAADAVFPSLGALVPGPGGDPLVIDLPWELVRGSTTR